MKRLMTWSMTLVMITLLIWTASCASASTPAPTTSSPAPSTSAPNASPTPGQGRGANGTLAKIDGNTLTLTTTQGSVMVNVGSDTTIQKTINGALSDLHEGDLLSVIGTKDASGNRVATSITVRPQRQDNMAASPGGAPSVSGGPRGNGSPRSQQGGNSAQQFVNGSLAKIDDNVWTLTTTQGSVTVNVGSDTVVQKTVAGTISDLHEGESLNVFGSRDASGNITATSIMIRSQS